MKEQNFKDEVAKILEEAPKARKALRENYENLLNVADYCYNTYTQSGENTQKALEETKNFTTQSLASVAYQISTLANSVLSLLDAQNNQLRQMESSINLIGQTVEMHKEKVSRREIGAFTTVRRVPRNHKIIPPTAAQPRQPYSRRPINYQQLDEIGHGIKVSGKQPEKTGTIRKHGASVRSNKAPEPVQCPVAPPVGGSSFGKPVAPPTIPATWQSPPECDIITNLLDEAPLPPPLLTDELLPQSDDVISALPPPPPPPDSSGVMVAPTAPPPPPPPPSSSGVVISQSAPPPPPPPPSSGAVINHGAPAPPPIPSLSLETVLEENSLPPPSPPPPPSDDIGFPPLPNDDSELLAPPPPPPPSQDADVTLTSRRSRRRRSPPTTRSVSLRVRSGPASRCRYTRSLFLPSVQSFMIPPPPPYPPPNAPQDPPISSSSSFAVLSHSLSSSRLCLPARLEHLDLQILAPPPPLPLADVGCFDDIMPPLPPPVDYDTSAPPDYLEKVVALYYYEASKPDDLSLAEGDIIYVTRRHDDGWCEGVCNGREGFFPQNYVQSCD
ncbi:ABI family, member 3a isoform X1 [Cyprinodon tularosa]|uniref:ABI family, member 3a isoform X1 n=1 Tax=Cyprinodon tularosa TaxID=77115 RepID=UPI0018E1F5B6|nr:ABI family, member 3a isoform X1 [Cyprinodon tularosa]